MPNDRDTSASEASTRPAERPRTRHRALKIALAVVAVVVIAAAALIDLVVYGRLKDLTVCYRCHSEFRGAYPRTAPAFDLHTADILEQEYERRIGRR